MIGGRRRKQPTVSLFARLAGAAADEYIRHGLILPAPSPLPSEVARQRACYVYVLENPGRRVRNVVGHPLPTQRTLADEIIKHTITAVDGLFRRADLPQLSFRVAVLDQLQRVTDPDHLDPARFGLYVRSEQGKTALLLPGRTGVETGTDQIATAIREAHIDPQRDQATLYRFGVTYYD